MNVVKKNQFFHIRNNIPIKYENKITQGNTLCNKRNYSQPGCSQHIFLGH